MSVYYDRIANASGTPYTIHGTAYQLRDPQNRAQPVRYVAGQRTGIRGSHALTTERRHVFRTRPEHFRGARLVR